MACKYVKEFEFPGSGKTPVKGYMRGGPVKKAPAMGKEAKAEEKREAKASGCTCGATPMKKGGKATPKKAEKLTPGEAKMAQGILSQMAAQAQQTGRMPGVPQGLPAPGARAVPVAPSRPMIPQQAQMKHGGKK